MEGNGQFHVPTALPPGKEPPVPVRYEAGWVPESAWTTWRIHLVSAGNKTPAVQPVAIPTELSRLSAIDSIVRKRAIPRVLEIGLQISQIVIGAEDGEVRNGNSDSVCICLQTNVSLQDSITTIVLPTYFAKYVHIISKKLFRTTLWILMILTFLINFQTSYIIISEKSQYSCELLKWIWGSYGSDYAECTNLLGCDAVWSGRNLQTFRRNLLAPSSGSKTKRSK
jgi:hypothetical protein